MKTIFLFLTTGFEEIEALATVDILRRATLTVKTVSITGERTVTGSHGVPVIADLMFEEVDFDAAQMLVLPGGTPTYKDHDGLRSEVLAFYEKGGKVAAICASPMVFGVLGILKGRPATCYPGFEKYLEGAILQTDKAVIIDDNIMTGRGPGLTIDFALAIVEVLAGKAKRGEVAGQLLVN
ncbi:MAG: DJ-1/PfpI family protein [Alistipes sp.]|nr:DJ-1/PfpI family protein [Alistipes sp.]